MKVATAKDLCELLRKYNAVSVGDVGITEAYTKFLKDAGIKRTQPTKGQKEVLNLLKCLRGVRPKPDEGRERGIEQIKARGYEDRVLDDEDMLCCSLIGTYAYRAVKDVLIETCLHQDAKTASIKDQECKKNEAIAFETGKTEGRIECQQRIEGIKRKIEERYFPDALIGVKEERMDFRISPSYWDAIWGEEGL